MPNEFLPTASCIWGVPAHMNVGDLSRPYNGPGTIAISQVSTTTRSDVLSLGAKALKFQVAFQSPAVTCTLNLYTTAGGVDTLVWSAPATYTSSELYAGNLEYVDLQGADVKVEAANLVGGWVSVTVCPNN
jgi:hypothetical protein